jgi:hypothetical protein
MFSLRMIFFLAVVLVSSAARATVESPEVLAGIAAYNDLDYERAVELLQKAVRQTLTREEKIAAYKTLAFCHVAMNKKTLAIADFETVLRIDDSFELDRTRSPRERAAFEQAKARFATGQGESREARSLTALRPEVAPPSQQAGFPVKLRVHYPGGLADQLDLFYRTRGLGVYNRLSSKGDNGGHFELTVPGPRVQAPGLEYYMVALDESGASVAKAGSLARPLSVNVFEIKKPIYKRAWFWALMGGIVAVGVGTTIAVLYWPTNPSVTIMPY